MKRTDEELTEQTIRIIEDDGVILLRKKNDKNSYLHQHTEIAAGPDHAIWTGRKFFRKQAKEFFNLKWALTIAPLYNCKVVVVYPKKK